MSRSKGTRALLTAVAATALAMAARLAAAQLTEGLYTSGKAGMYAALAVITIAAALVPGLIYVSVYKKALFARPEKAEEKKPSLPVTAGLTLAAAALCTGLNFGISLAASALGFAQGGAVKTESAAEFAAAIVVLALLPAVCEETIFRGFLLGTMRDSGEFTAVAVSAVFFAVMHSGAAIVYAVLAGLVLGFLRIKTSLPAAIAAHFLTNAAALVISGVM